MQCMVENPIVEPKELPPSPIVEAETLLTTEVLQETLTDDDDDCVICYLTKYRPAKTACGHSACESCMLQWALMAMQVSPEDSQLASSLSVDGIKFKCATCRTYTEAKFDDEQTERLKARYPEEYVSRAAEFATAADEVVDEHAIQTMILMFGNSHRKVPPTVSPYTGKIRTHEWTFFVQSSRQEIVEQVQVILHPTFRNDRLVTLMQPPFSTTHLGWGCFTVYAGIQLTEGWQWVDEGMAVDSATGRKQDRLPLEWSLDFGGNGSQRNKVVKFRKMREEVQEVVEDEEDDLGALVALMSEAEIVQYKETRRLREAARRAHELQ